MRATIAVQHNYETAHRLPVLPGKCQCLHGHSWLAKAYVSAELDENGVTLDYGRLKSLFRNFIDSRWDHGTALGKDDPLVQTLWDDPHHAKTYVFGVDTPLTVRDVYLWPTVEAFAHVLALHIQEELDSDSVLSTQFPRVERVEIRETSVNFAVWDRSFD